MTCFYILILYNLVIPLCVIETCLMVRRHLFHHRVAELTAQGLIIHCTLIFDKTGVLDIFIDCWALKIFKQQENTKRLSVWF